MSFRITRREGLLKYRLLVLPLSFQLGRTGVEHAIPRLLVQGTHFESHHTKHRLILSLCCKTGGNILSLSSSSGHHLAFISKGSPEPSMCQVSEEIFEILTYPRGSCCQCCFGGERILEGLYTLMRALTDSGLRGGSSAQRQV